MAGNTFLFMVLSGLCFLPACFPHVFILVEKAKTWAEAQSYCRWKYTDLASVHNEQDWAHLNELIGSYDPIVWIGLYDDVNSWRWSLGEEGYYGKGGAKFRRWRIGEPDNANGYQNCVAMETKGTWADNTCSERKPFVCYNDAKAVNISSFIFVNESKTWSDAQGYCWNYYIDLASVRNQAENDQIEMMTQNQPAWIGLHRDSWKWSDGSHLSFSNWHTDTEDPNGGLLESCVASNYSKWEDWPCSSEHFFVCYSGQARKQVLRMVLTKTGSSMDLEAMKQVVLQKVNQRLKDHGLSEDVRLRWVKQPDGKIFHKKRTEEEEEEEEEKICVTS